MTRAGGTRLPLLFLLKLTVPQSEEPLKERFGGLFLFRAVGICLFDGVEAGGVLIRFQLQA